MIIGGVSKMTKKPLESQKRQGFPRENLWEWYKTRFDFDWPSQNWMRV